MKKIKVLSAMTAILCFVTFLQAPGHTDAEEPDNNWQLTWSDEFDGNTLDSDVWSYETGNWILNENGGYETSGWGNNEQEFYTDKNAVVSNGTLKIQAKKETYVDEVQGTYEYTSSKLVTKNKFSMCYGKIDIRARVDSGKSLWPAIWMLPEDNVYGAWASSGELDIMEGYGSMPEKICGTIHFGDVWPNNKFLTNEYFFNDNDSTENWHVYSVEWEDDQIRWYVDDVLYSSQSDWSSSGRAYPAPFDQNFYLILNLAVGGHFDGIDGIYADPTIFADGPKQMEVDYVRVYQRDGISHTPSSPAHATLKPYFMDGGVGIMSNSDNGTEISITNAGEQTYSVMGALEGLDVGPKRKFSVDFDIWSSVSREIEMTVENSSYDRYYDKKIAINKDPVHCHYDFTFEDAQNVNLKIQAGNVSDAAALGAHKVNIANLKWTEDGKENVSQTTTAAVSKTTQVSHTSSPVVQAILKQYFMDGGVGRISNSDNGTEILVTDAGTETYSVMAALEGLEAGPGKQFSVDFDMWSSVPRDIEVTVENASYYRFFDKTISLNKEPAHYHYDISFEDAQNVDLKIQAGNVEGAAALGEHKVYISDLKWTEKGSQTVTVPVTDITAEYTPNTGSKTESESVSVPSVPAESILYGDVNLDSRIDITDMTYISLYCLRDIKLSDKAFKNADVVTDGEVNLADLATMKQYIMKDDIVLGKK